MNRGDQMLGKIETGERQSGGGAAGSDDRVNEQLRVAFKDLLRPSPQPKPEGDLHEVMAAIGRHLNNESLALKTIYDHLLAVENQTKKRGSRGFTRYLLAICIGVAATLAWQSYGEATKQMFATKAPELGWSLGTKQMIANWVEQLGWTKPPPDAERTAVHPSVPEAQVATVAQTVPAAFAPQAPAAPPVDPEQVHQIAVDLAALGQTVGRLAASQDQIGRNIAEILVKMPEPPPPPPIAAAPEAAGRPAPGGAPPSENTQNTAPTSASLPVGHAVTDGALLASCGPDVQRFCGRITRENGGVIKCLSSHRIELSPTCDAYFNKMPVHRAAEKGEPKAISPNR
jgi:Cysteine rich repeat